MTTTTTGPAGAETDRVVANLRAAREPVYDPTNPVQVVAVERLRADQDDAPVRIECPGLGCHGEAWRLPDGNVYCEAIKGIVPTGPESLAVLPRQALERPSSLVDAVLDSAAHQQVSVANGPGVYGAAEHVAGLLLDILVPAGGVR